MTTSQFESKPAVISFGRTRGGQTIAWININARPCVDTAAATGHAWAADTCRCPLTALTLDALLAAAEDELLLGISDEELAAVLETIGAADAAGWAKARAAQTLAHDRGGAVNSFLLDGEAMWLDKATRVGLVNSVRAEKEAGRENTTLWHGGARHELGVDAALAMLRAVELYALACYNVTASHLAAICGLGADGSDDAVAALACYDYRSGYPPRLQLQTLQSQADAPTTE